MPKYLAIGVDYERFMSSCPKELEPFVEAERLRILKRDEDMWVMGMYVQNAVSVAVEHCLAGKKAKSQYLKLPLREKMEEENKISEEKLQRQREQFVAQLMIMKTNFELNKENAKNDSA